MAELLHALKGISVAEIIPILSDSNPLLFITPEHPADLVKIKILCHQIRNALQVPINWENIPMNGAWTLRLRIPPRICIDVMTHLPSVQETPKIL